MIKYALLILAVLFGYLYFFYAVILPLLLILVWSLSTQFGHGFTFYYSPCESTERIIKSCPSLLKGFRPTLYLFSGFLQGFFGMTQGSLPGQTRYCDEVNYREQLLTLKDGGIICIDWSLEEESPNASKVLVIAPGLGSDSRSQNTRTIVIEAKKRGYIVAVVHGRGIRAPLKTLRCFSICNWQDFGFAIAEIQKKYPKFPLVAIGNSMGGTNLTMYAAKTKEKCLLRALATVAPPLDASLSAIKLQSKWNSFGLFDSLIKGVLIKLIKSLEPTLRTWPDELEKLKIDFDHIFASATAYDIDDRYTSKMVGLKDAEEYYREGSPHKIMSDIKIPYLSIHSKDDPIVNYQSQPFEEYKRNKGQILALSRSGGHVGFFSGFITPHRWFPNPCLEFLDSVLNN